MKPGPGASDARGESDDDKTPPLGEVLEFMRLLWAIDHGLQTISKKMEAHLGVTGLQRMVLRLVGRFPGISAGTLAKILHLHPSTLTGVLRRLETRKLLERKQDPEDLRRALFVLSSKGRHLDLPSVGTVEAAVQRSLWRVSPAKISGARQMLKVLAEELAGEQDTPPRIRRRTPARTAARRR